MGAQPGPLLCKTDGESSWLLKLLVCKWQFMVLLVFHWRVENTGPKYVISRAKQKAHLCFRALQAFWLCAEAKQDQSCAFVGIFFFFSEWNSTMGGCTSRH